MQEGASQTIYLNPLIQLRRKLRPRRPFRWYTHLEGRGARLSGNALVYIEIRLKEKTSYFYFNLGTTVDSRQ